MVNCLRQGWTQDQIALHLGITQQQVSLDFKLVQKQWKEQRLAGMDDYVDLKLAEYAEVKKEAWAAWERSKADAEKRRVRDSDSGGFEETETSGQCGNPAYLQTVLSAIHAERALLGLDAPKETRVKGEVLTQTIDWAVLAWGVPTDGIVPDEVDAEIQKVLALPRVAEAGFIAGPCSRKPNICRRFGNPTPNGTRFCGTPGARSSKTFRNRSRCSAGGRTWHGDLPSETSTTTVSPTYSSSAWATAPGFTGTSPRADTGSGCG
jgi:hypothetical protein